MVFGSVLRFILSLFGPHYLPRFLSRNKVCGEQFGDTETRATNVETNKLTATNFSLLEL
jgi:hypothetical protein